MPADEVVGVALSGSEDTVTQTTTDTMTAAWPWPHFPRTNDPSVGVDPTTYDNLVRYTKYASGAYQLLCPRPMGNTLVAQFHDLVTSTQGFIARDDKREELIVAFRGTTDVPSILVDASIILALLEGPGLPPLDPSLVTRSANSQPRVHVGFLLSYKSIARSVLNRLGPQVEKYPSYKIVVCGHSLGGAVASIAAIAFTHTFPRRSVSLYTFGQPRTGNAAFAELVERAVGVDNIYRCVHLIDGVPTMIPTLLGYRHFATEYWEFTELGRDSLPPRQGHRHRLPTLTAQMTIASFLLHTGTKPVSLGPPKNVKRLEGGENPEGSASIPSSGVNPAHWVYFRQPIASDPTVCI